MVDVWNFSFDTPAGVFSQRYPFRLDRWVDIDNTLWDFYFSFIYVIETPLFAGLSLNQISSENFKR